MLGWINLSIKSFIIDSFGAQAWEDVLQHSGVSADWVSSCPYSDKHTYECVNAALLLSSLLDLVVVWCGAASPVLSVSDVPAVCVAAAHACMPWLVPCCCPSCSIVITAAGLLGVEVNDALEAYGGYFIKQYLSSQVCSELVPQLLLLLPLLLP